MEIQMHVMIAIRVFDVQVQRLCCIKHKECASSEAWNVWGIAVCRGNMLLVEEIWCFECLYETDDGFMYLFSPKW